MEDLLKQLEALKLAFGLIKPSAVIEENIRRESLLKSSLYSAKIEGNQLSYEAVISGLNDKTKAKLEVFNLLKAHKFIYSAHVPKKLSVGLIKKLHQIIMDRLMPTPGKFRTEAGAIFNQAGVAVYFSPPPNEINGRLTELIKKINTGDEAIPLKAAKLHFLFEKIHPFIDGNGRVGRLLTAEVMQQGGYGFKGLISIEEAINRQKDEYYDALNENKDPLPLTRFLLKLYLEQGKKILTQLTTPGIENLPILPLRRQEILSTIKDHPYSSFDFIRRRFFNVNPKTLHYDLKKLQEQKLIVKVGATRGAVYWTSGRRRGLH
jgi:Fic family protein